MNKERLIEYAKSILLSHHIEDDGIEYKKSALQKEEILKTIIGFCNNYSNHPNPILLLGVEETNDDKEKATPKFPILGYSMGEIELVENQVRALLPYMSPKPQLDFASVEVEERYVVVVSAPKQGHGPFEANEKATKVGLKRGRYVRIGRETRLATAKEEMYLLKRFSNYHFTEEVNQTATINDLDMELIQTFLKRTSHRKSSLNPDQMRNMLKLEEQGNPLPNRVFNHAVLLFCPYPERFIPGCEIEIIRSIRGSVSLMEGKVFSGSLWKIHDDIIRFFQTDIQRSMVFRYPNASENRIIYNYPFQTFDELLTNAIVHKDYETGKRTRIYLYEDRIQIVNYNRPLPPLDAKALNEQDLFPNRDYENPTLCKEFQELGLIEDFGSGIKEAKNAMRENGNEQISFEIFAVDADMTSVIIPINKEFLQAAKMEAGTSMPDFSILRERIQNSDLSSHLRQALEQAVVSQDRLKFTRKDFAQKAGISLRTASRYLDLLSRLNLVTKTEGNGYYQLFLPKLNK